MAKDIPPLKQLCYRVATLKHSLTPEEIKDLILTTSQKKKGTMTTWSKSARFNPGGRATCLKHVLEQILEVDSSSPLYLSVLQHFGNDENKFNVIDFFLCDMAFFENLTYIATVIDNPSETDLTKVISSRYAPFLTI